MNHRALTLLALLLCSCATLEVRNEETAATAPIPTTPIRWRTDPTCLNAQPQRLNLTRETLAAACNTHPPRDLISVALSGGGTKAAVFSGEALFYLDFLGLLERVSVVSSVSGGSFAGSIYALSCDPGTPCQDVHPHGRDRPVWQYQSIMRTLGQGYQALIDEQAARALTPFVPSTLSAGRFAQIIDTNFLGQGKDGIRFTFADLNPARPHLFLNATITSQNRVGLEDETAGPGCLPLQSRHFLRRRTPDEYFHFAFSDLYFSSLKSTIADYPLAAGVAASSAFPALIDFAELRDYCTKTKSNRSVQLMDGGANDNQALIEIYMVLSELVYRQHRSDLWRRQPAAIETLSAGDRAFLLLINASVTESTGTDGKPQTPFGLVGLVDAVISKSLAAIDVYSAEGYTLRKQSYLAQGELLRLANPNTPPIYPIEIALTALDQYAIGGTEAALRQKADPGDGNTTDIAATWSDRRAARQARAYDAIVEHKDIREQLRLSPFHPQCYYDMRKALDASLISVDEPDQACLKEGARWAAALRAQEMCDSNDPFIARPDGLTCQNGHVAPNPRFADRLPPLAPSTCQQRITAYLNTTAATPEQRRVLCRPL